ISSSSSSATRMNPAIQSIVLLVCVAVCTGASKFLKCRCLRTSQRVDESLIRTVEELPPRPYCAKDEIIVTLKDNKKVCLDPTHKFTKMNKASHCDKTEINMQLK
uniref:Chemokine interleukin-8-like domain-containing protein n=1 Tax=Oryzias melastigma TaxID=30732 RepID=A0A3B3DNM2_ORYME